MTIKAVVFDAYGTLYDVQSVAAITDEAFPGYGKIITQIWRLKQLEYTWLRSLMLRYEDFSIITRELISLHAAVPRAEERPRGVRAYHGKIRPSRSLSRCDGNTGRIEGPQARDTVERQRRYAQFARCQYGAGPDPGCHNQRRFQKDLQTSPRRLHADRIKSRQLHLPMCCSSPQIHSTPAAPRRSD